MKAFLLHQDCDFAIERKLPANHAALVQDLELDTLFQAMAQGDEVVLDVSRKVVLASLADIETIRFRQCNLEDCLKNAASVRELYAIATETLTNKKMRHLGLFSYYPGSILYDSRNLMQMLAEMLKKLKQFTDQSGDRFQSAGFKRFFAMITQELDDEYFSRIENHLKELRFDDGVLISAKLGQGNEGTNYVLRKSQEKKQNWLQRIFAKNPPAYTIQIHPRDEGGARALGGLRDRGINLVANAIAQASEHILNFFSLLRVELAFYVGCLNLYEQLTSKGYAVSIPLPAPAWERRHSYVGLFEVCLALTVEQKIVCNDGKADHKDFVLITGANQGGKSTYLRSIGVAQLMMQSGMFAPAASFCANLCDGLFTHYKREEDKAMNSGKLEEELQRMNEMVQDLKPNSLVLFNESFAATNEREGSEIARQIACALIESGVKVFFVTHLYEFAHSMAEKKLGNAFFLRAERQDDGNRTFKLSEGEPLRTSFGEDLYAKIFTEA